MDASIRATAAMGCSKLELCEIPCIAQPLSESVVLDVYAKVREWKERHQKEKVVWLDTILVLGKREGGRAILTTGTPLNKNLCDRCFRAYNGISSSTWGERKMSSKRQRMTLEYSGSGGKQRRWQGKALKAGAGGKMQ
jgi:hypothetical protein